MNNLKKQLEERLTSIEDAYNETGYPEMDFSAFPDKLREKCDADYKAYIIVEAARKIERECGLGEIDWEDGSQRKWTPYFWMSPSGFAFWDSSCGRADAHAGTGSRLRVLSETTADHIGKTFLKVWETVQLK